MEKSTILVLTTGGTIEKSYNEKDGSLKNRNSLLKKRLLSKMRLPHTSIELHELMAKDSLDMTLEDRKFILDSARDKLGQGYPLVILHGTDTMAETASYFYENLSGSPVPILFTGAMRPFGFDGSDATQNIVEALMAAQLVEPGIYVSFHNKIFPLPGVTKDRKLGTFIKS